MSKCLIDCYDNLERVRTIKEVYYIKGIIRTLEDILYKYCEDSRLIQLNMMIVNHCGNKV